MTSALGGNRWMIFHSDQSCHQYCSTLHQWPVHHIMLQICLCRRHLFCPASPNVCWTINDSDITPHYCCCWHLKLSTTKTLAGVFHLHNSIASNELLVIIDGQWLKREQFSMYLEAWQWIKHYHTRSTWRKQPPSYKAEIASCQVGRYNMECQCIYPPYISPRFMLLTCAVWSGGSQAKR